MRGGCLRICNVIQSGANPNPPPLSDYRIFELDLTNSITVNLQKNENFYSCFSMWFENYYFFSYS